MTENDKILFTELCKASSKTLTVQEQTGIGTYKEKRLHKIIKNFVCPDESFHEADIGSYVADVCKNGIIYEIQTKNLCALCPKLKYYLSNTDYDIKIIHPVISGKMIYRICPESGELIRKKRSPLHKGHIDLLPELYGIREFIGDPRISVTVMLIEADEYRYSERVRFRKSGAYDSELFPTALVDIAEYNCADDFRQFLPDIDGRFSASDFSKLTKLKGRDLYSALNFLSHIGLLRRSCEGRKYVYEIINQNHRFNR